VAYTPDWEPLADALKRVMAIGVSEDEAKRDLCRAVADQKIRVRIRIAAWNRVRGGELFSGGNVRQPAHLVPDDFDWVRSYPRSPWPIGPRWGERRNREWVGGWGPRVIALIELSTTDVIEVVCNADISAREPIGKQSATVKRETEATKALALHLQCNRDLKREDASIWCREQGYNLTDRGFKGRIWPNARASAGLPIKGPPGRKRKSAR
jgi:hypothetical protein